MEHTNLKIAIVGIGLIGGSIGLSLRKQGYFVTGWDINVQTLQLAKVLGSVDVGTSPLYDVVKDADVIFVCTPVGELYRTIEQLSQMPLKEGCIITDVGSVKNMSVEIAQFMRDLPYHYIGGHPMTGSEKSGVEAASVLLLENAFYILTPSDDVPKEAVERLKAIITTTKAKVVITDPKSHDRIVGAISHLPHVVAATLVNQIGAYNAAEPLHHLLAAGGFRDITRIASSNSSLWRDILLANRDNILPLLDDWAMQLGRFQTALEAADAEGIESLFASARQFRDSLLEKRKGVLPQLFECYVDVPDQPGIIGKVATILGVYNLNLDNIAVMENREYAQGVIRLTFATEAEKDKAVQVLREIGYPTYIRD